MRVALLYLPAEDEGEYAEALNGVEKLEYDIDSVAILPVGSAVHLTDATTKKSVVFRVVKLHYHPVIHALYLHVVVEDDSVAITPEEFFNYMLTDWKYHK